MRIFQTEVEDDDEDGEGDEGEDEDGGSGKEEEPPIPPPRSKSKESSLSSRGGGGALRSKEDVTEGGMGGGLGPAASRSPNDRFSGLERAPPPLHRYQHVSRRMHPEA